jgi:5-(carboxyamino)imidazole ribonucleotide synthase
MSFNLFNGNTRLGILGGGQLGSMLIESCIPYGIPVHVLDSDPNAPAGTLTNHFDNRDFRDFEAVLSFGRGVDLITIEIEHVNTDALSLLCEEGKEIHPSPEIIALVQDKGRQKEFYRRAGFPTSDFVLTGSSADVREHAGLIPAVHKTRRSGYDGKGVQKILTHDEIDSAFNEPGVLERLVRVAREISVITARDRSGRIVSYRPVELIFNEEKNLLEYLVSPASLSPDLEQRAMEIATELASSLGIVGVLAVEMFVNDRGELLINEIAPRPHNSGHHTIEAAFTSQYEQHIRAIGDLPLGSTDQRAAAVMINLLGEEKYEGPARYENLDAALSMKGVYVHLYGKKLTRPYRKMGHITILDEDTQAALQKAKKLKSLIRVVS